jgi:hypothetical protein
MTTMTVDRLGAGSVTGPATRPGPHFLTAPFAGRTWREQGYLALVLLLAPFAFTYTVFAVSFTASIAVTVVGLFVAGAVVLGARGWGAAYRSLARELLGADVPAPTSYVRPRGFWRTVGSMLGDAAGWRALLFMFIALPLSIMAFVVSVTFLGTGLGGLTYWFWYRFLPPQLGSDGELHRGAQFGDAYFLDTPPRLALAALAGLVVILCWPWVTRMFTMLFRALTRGLLSPTRASLRVAELERSRTGTVDDADARLRSSSARPASTWSTAATSTRRPSSSTPRTPPPRRPSRSCASWRGASTRPPSTAVWRSRSRPSPHGRRCPSPWTSTPRSRPAAAWPRLWSRSPTSPSPSS